MIPTMGLAQDIQQAVISSARPLGDALRMTRILAAKLDNALLRDWADRELNGYPKDAPLPAYRAERPVDVRGDFVGDAYEARNVPISPLHLKAEFRADAVKGLFRIRFSAPIASYEDAVQHEAVEFREPWPYDTVLLVQPEVFEGMHCTAAWRVVYRGTYIGIIDAVRNRLLDLVLELERQVPEAGEVPSTSLPARNEQITQIVEQAIFVGEVTMDQSIHSQGTIGNLAGGQGNVIQQGDAHITQGADLASLLPALRATVQELGTHLATDQVDAADELVDSLEEETSRSHPRLGRLRGFLQGLAGIAHGAGEAGAGVIDAVQRIDHALGT
jgi:hypothetical protein